MTSGEGTATLLGELRAVVGDAHVLVGEDVSARAAHFWNPEPLRARALVRPGSTRETAAVLARCDARAQSVVTRGGVTGLAGGERSGADDVVLSLERMNAIESLDPLERTITVGAGCVLERVQDAARESGLQFGLDLGARGSCTIGGNVATNAGGLSVLRYGMMREQLLGLEVALADGTVLSSMNAQLKNNTGYDLKHLFVGSEGTLGVVTRAVLRLRPATPATATALVAFDDFDAAQRLLARLGESLEGTLNAYEIIWKRFYRLNTDPEHAGSAPSPLSREHPLYALVESRGADAERTASRFEAALGEALDAGLVVDAVLAQSERERAALWPIRENIEIVLRHAPVFTYDVSLPIGAMARYVDELEAALRARWPESLLYAYGHVADGNLHLIVAPRPFGDETPLPAERERAWHAESDELVYAPLGPLGGSVSAEHGIGLDKKAHLGRTRGEAEIATMRALKRMLDPNGILNPGKIV